jgi:hypothetical protein
MVEGYMNIYTFEEILEQIKGRDVTALPFWRGEALKHKYFTCMIEQLAKVAESIVLATNGVLVNYRNLPPHILELLDVITVSIHGKASADGLERLRRMRLAMLGSDRFFPKPKIAASRVRGEKITDVNWTEVINRIDEDELRIYTQHTVDSEGNFIGWGKIKWGNIENPHKGKLDRKFCERLNTDLQICWDGSVSRCCHKWTPDFPDALNVNRMSIADIWNSPEMQSIRDNYKNDETCSGCDQWIGGGKTL